MKGLIAFIPLVGLAVLFQVFFNEINPVSIFEDLLNKIGLGDPAQYNPDLQDIDRKIWNFSAILALSDNAYNLLFGWGLRTGGYIVVPYVYDLFLEAGRYKVYTEDVATPGFAALAVDTARRDHRSARRAFRGSFGRQEDYRESPSQFPSTRRQRGGCASEPACRRYRQRARSNGLSRLGERLARICSRPLW